MGFKRTLSIEQNIKTLNNLRGLRQDGAVFICVINTGYYIYTAYAVYNAKQDKLGYMVSKEKVGPDRTQIKTMVEVNGTNVRCESGMKIPNSVVEKIVEFNNKIK